LKAHGLGNLSSKSCDPDARPVKNRRVERGNQMYNRQSTKHRKLKVAVNSNWEFVAFYLIEPFITERNRQFKRTQVVNERTLGNALLFLDVLGHKKQPEHPEKTLQKTLQNMRDKGWIKFVIMVSGLDF
jgi:hypothetical protein